MTWTYDSFHNKYYGSRLSEDFGGESTPRAPIEEWEYDLKGSIMYRANNYGLEWLSSGGREVFTELASGNKVVTDVITSDMYEVNYGSGDDGEEPT